VQVSQTSKTPRNKSKSRNVLKLKLIVLKASLTQLLTMLSMVSLKTNGVMLRIRASLPSKPSTLSSLTGRSRPESLKSTPRRPGRILDLKELCSMLS
jgi:hypothetical protein